MRQDQPMAYPDGIKKLNKIQPVTADRKTQIYPSPKGYPINYPHENGTGIRGIKIQ